MNSLLWNVTWSPWRQPWVKLKHWNGLLGPKLPSEMLEQLSMDFSCMYIYCKIAMKCKFLERLQKFCTFLLLPKYQGRIQDFLKEGAPKLRTIQNFDTQLWGQGVSEGDVPPQKQRKIVIFKVNLHDLVHSFCLGYPHKVRCPISAKNKRGHRPGAQPCAPPLNLPLSTCIRTVPTHKFWNRYCQFFNGKSYSLLQIASDISKDFFF